MTSSDGELKGRTNFAGSGTMNGFVETISGKEVPPVEIRADSVDFAAAVNGVSVNDFRAILAFIIEHADEKKLKRAESEELTRFYYQGTEFEVPVDQWSEAYERHRIVCDAEHSCAKWRPPSSAPPCCSRAARIRWCC